MGSRKEAPSAAGHDRASHGPAAAPPKSAAWSSPRREEATPSGMARTLARRVGYQRAQRILAPPDPGGTAGRPVQPKLAINAPGDAYEREADRVADAVMRGASAGTGLHRSAAALHRCACGGTCAACRAEEEDLHREEGGSSPSPGFAPPIVHDVLSSPGRPLEAGTRAFMEHGFGVDFGGVRVHTDGRAAESARAVNAHAYTVGHDVVFAAGRYAPRTRDGDRLIAHELSHTLQQGRGAASAGVVQRAAPGGHQAATVKSLAGTFAAEEIGAIYASNWERDFSQGHPAFANAVIAWQAMKNHAAKHHGDPGPAAAVFKAAVAKLLHLLRHETIGLATAKSFGDYQYWEHMDRPSKDFMEEARDRVAAMLVPFVPSSLVPRMAPNPGPDVLAQKRWQQKSNGVAGYILDAGAHIKDQIVAAIDVFRELNNMPGVGNGIDNWKGVEKPAGYVAPVNTSPKSVIKTLPWNWEDRMHVASRAPIREETAGLAVAAGAKSNQKHDPYVWRVVGQHLGRAMHAFQDFWFHSNWLELARLIIEKNGKATNAQLITGTFDLPAMIHALGHKVLALAMAFRKDQDLLRKAYGRTSASKSAAPNQKWTIDDVLIAALGVAGRFLIQQADAHSGPGSHGKLAKDQPEAGKDYEGAMKLAEAADRMVFAPLRAIMDEREVSKALAATRKQLALVDRMLQVPSPSHPLWPVAKGAISGPSGPYQWKPNQGTAKASTGPLSVSTYRAATPVHQSKPGGKAPPKKGQGTSATTGPLSVLTQGAVTPVHQWKPGGKAPPKQGKSITPGTMGPLSAPTQGAVTPVYQWKPGGQTAPKQGQGTAPSTTGLLPVTTYRAVTPGGKTPRPLSPNTAIYVVQKGDTLSAIALKFLGAASRWTEIYEENRHVIGDDPAAVTPGMQLLVHKPVDAYTLPQVILAALEPGGGLIRIKGMLLQHIIDHPTTAEFRSNFVSHLMDKVAEHHLNSGTGGRRFKGIYPETWRAVSYGGDMWDPSEYYSPKLGTWLLGNCFPRIQYEIRWVAQPPTGGKAIWTAEWTINDDYDLQPGKEKAAFYNAVASVLTLVWHDLLGGRRNAPIQAKWRESGTLPEP